MTVVQFKNPVQVAFEELENLPYNNANGLELAIALWAKAWMADGNTAIRDFPRSLAALKAEAKRHEDAGLEAQIMYVLSATIVGIRSGKWI